MSPFVDPSNSTNEDRGIDKSSKDSNTVSRRQPGDVFTRLIEEMNCDHQRAFIILRGARGRHRTWLIEGLIAVVVIGAITTVVANLNTKRWIRSVDFDSGSFDFVEDVVDDALKPLEAEMGRFGL